MFYNVMNMALKNLNVFLYFHFNETFSRKNLFTTYKSLLLKKKLTLYFLISRKLIFKCEMLYKQKTVEKQHKRFTIAPALQSQ